MKFELRLTILNEGHDMPLAETFTGSAEQLLARLSLTTTGLAKLFPEGRFTVRIENVQNTVRRFYDAGKMYDDLYNEIPTQVLITSPKSITL